MTRAALSRALAFVTGALVGALAVTVLCVVAGAIR